MLVISTSLNVVNKAAFSCACFNLFAIVCLSLDILIRSSCPCSILLSDGSGLLFPGTSQGKALSDMTLSKLVKELGFDADVHGFRTSFKTWAQEKTGFANEVSEMALAHTIKNKAEAAYARSDLIEKRKEMMEQWAEYLAR